MAGVKVPLIAMHHAYVVTERIEGIQVGTPAAASQKMPDCRLRNQTGGPLFCSAVKNRRHSFHPHVYSGASYQGKDTTSRSVNSQHMLVSPFYIFPSASVLSMSSGCWLERNSAQRTAADMLSESFPEHGSTIAENELLPGEGYFSSGA